MLRGIVLFRRTWWPYKGRLALGGLLVIFMALMAVAAPWPLKIIVDDGLKHKQGYHRTEMLLQHLPSYVRDDPHRLLAVCLAALVTITVLGAIADYLSEMFLEGAGERISADLRRLVYGHLQHLPLHVHDAQRTGDLVTKATTDVGYVESMLVALLSVLVPSVTLIAVIAAVCLLINPFFAFVALGVTPLLFGLTVHYRSRIKQAAKTARKRDSDIAADITETFASVRAMQAFGAEQHHLDRFDHRNLRRLDAGLLSVRLKATLGPLVDTVVGLGSMLVLLIGVREVQRGTMTVGLLLVFLSYLKAVYDPMKSLAKLTTVVSRGGASVERLEDLLRLEPDVFSPPNGVTPERAAGSVELRDVRFAYPGREEVLHGVNMCAEPGEVIALVGATGAGKSTITSLLSRLYDVTGGQILLDGVDLRRYDLDALRRQVAVVQQEATMFDGSVFDNIKYGSPGATDEQVLVAAAAAHVDEFASRLPHGYDTHITERGVSLSGGQRQRIGIARALLRDAPVVVLDEPTSGLDAIAERAVLRGLEGLMAGRTVLVIAHRLSTIKRADRIYVLDDGRVAEQGTHSELMAREGIYSRMERVLREGSASLSGMPVARVAL